MRCHIKALGLDPNVTVHSLRVTVLSTARERGSDRVDFQDFAGHDSGARRPADRPHLHPGTRPAQRKPSLRPEIIDRTIDRITLHEVEDRIMI